MAITKIIKTRGINFVFFCNLKLIKINKKINPRELDNFDISNDINGLRYIEYSLGVEIQPSLHLMW